MENLRFNKATPVAASKSIREVQFGSKDLSTLFFRIHQSTVDYLLNQARYHFDLTDHAVNNSCLFYVLRLGYVIEMTTHAL